MIGAVAGIPTGPVLFTEYIPVFGANQFVPSLAQLSALSYAPIPLTVALQQFGPAAGVRRAKLLVQPPRQDTSVRSTPPAARTDGRADKPADLPH